MILLNKGIFVNLPPGGEGSKGTWLITRQAMEEIFEDVPTPESKKETKVEVKGRSSLVSSKEKVKKEKDNKEGSGRNEEKDKLYRNPRLSISDMRRQG